MAHASVASLMRTIESLLTSNSPMRSLSCDHREEFCTPQEKVSSLEVFLKNFEKNNVSGEMTDFEVEVKEVAIAAEYTIQLRLAGTVLGENKSQKKKARRRFRQSLQQVAEDIDRIWKESIKIQDKGKQSSKESTVQEFPRSSKDILKVKNNMVGRDVQRERLVEHLTRSYSGEPKVIPIVRMGGIGKTTLANEVYNDACICSHFDVCAWATISQQHNVKEILLSLLCSTKSDTFDMNDEEELANMLQKSLKGKRYLIVLDDIWKREAWDVVRLCFPSENKWSGILLTTRNTEVARDAGTENLSLPMDLMGPDESWNLFKIVAFANEALPSGFETIGKQIAEKCHGLPLTIAVVAGLLKSKRAIEDWEINLDIPPEICELWNLQTFIVQGPSGSVLTINCPVQIWGLLQLRHLKLPEFYLPDCPSGSVDKGRHLDFSNIQTISYLSSHCCTKEVIMGIQNVKELGINGDEIDSNGLLNNLVHLQQLETLSLIKCFPLFQASAKAFPATLKKLKLEGTCLSWSYLDIIAELPNLEVLKLMLCACVGDEWNPNVRGFIRLKVLLMEGNDLRYWKATDDNFPVLEHLLLRKSSHLEEIPIEFAEIHTLQLIELSRCLPELGESAARIQKEQEDLGNNPVDVRMSYPCKYIVFIKVTLCLSFRQFKSYIKVI
ncbi:hypothetical protein T459_24248 [Capsicum annuum]|uniref:NB-ARC domain-containing protein n=1 Tax=Capsicum annuum TaxID=4072 RepID=A0A2G2YUQ9_CAPAN|nr:hypothetical protein T459_24248 [Capsicum annuum]